MRTAPTPPAATAHTPHSPLSPRAALRRVLALAARAPWHPLVSTFVAIIVDHVNTLTARDASLVTQVVELEAALTTEKAGRAADNERSAAALAAADAAVEAADDRALKAGSRATRAESNSAGVNKINHLLQMVGEDTEARSLAEVESIKEEARTYCQQAAAFCQMKDWEAGEAVTAQRDAEARAGAAIEERDATHDDNERLSSENKALVATYHQLRAENEALRSENEALRSEVEEARDAERCAHDQLFESSALARSLGDQLDDTSAAIATKTDHVEALKRDLAVAQAAVVEEERRADKMGTAHLHADMALAAAEGRLHRLQNEREASEEALHMEIDTLKTRACDAEARADAVEARLAEVTVELKVVRAASVVDVVAVVEEAEAAPALAAPAPAGGIDFGVDLATMLGYSSQSTAEEALLAKQAAFPVVDDAPSPVPAAAPTPIAAPPSPITPVPNNLTAMWTSACTKYHEDVAARAAAAEEEDLSAFHARMLIHKEGQAKITTPWVEDDEEEECTVKLIDVTALLHQPSTQSNAPTSDGRVTGTPSAADTLTAKQAKNAAKNKK